MESLSSEENSLTMHSYLLRDELAANLTDINKIADSIRTYRYDLSISIWKSIHIEKQRRQRLELYSSLIDILKSELEIAAHSVRWEGVVEVCTSALGLAFVKVWKPMYMTVTGGEIVLQDLAAFPYANNTENTGKIV
jgi:hypothetical protein